MMRLNKAPAAVPQRDAVGELEVGSPDHAEASRGVSRPAHVVCDLVEDDVRVGEASGPMRQMICAGKEVLFVAVAGGGASRSGPRPRRS